MNTPVNWRGEFKTVINGIELRVTSNGSGWRWIARRILDSKTLAASKPFPAADPAKDEALRWVRDQGYSNFSVESTNRTCERRIELWCGKSKPMTTGIYWVERQQRYQVRIGHGKKLYNLGCYAREDLDLAKGVRQEAEQLPPTEYKGLIAKYSRIRNRREALRKEVLTA